MNWIIASRVESRGSRQISVPNTSVYRCRRPNVRTCMLVRVKVYMYILIYLYIHIYAIYKYTRRGEEVFMCSSSRSRIISFVEMSIAVDMLLPLFRSSDFDRSYFAFREGEDKDWSCTNYPDSCVSQNRLNRKSIAELWKESSFEKRSCDSVARCDSKCRYNIHIERKKWLQLP